MNRPLLAALAAGVCVLTAPAAAPARNKPAAVAGPQYTPAFIRAAGPAQSALKRGDAAAAEPLVAAAEAAAASDDDRYAGAIFRLQLVETKLKAPAGQPVDQLAYAAALEALVNNPRTPDQERGRWAYQRGVVAYRSQKPAEAVIWFGRARQSGYTDDQFALAMAQAKIDSGDAAGGSADLDAAIRAIEATGRAAPEGYYRYGLGLTVRKKLRPEAVQWLRRWLSAFPTAKNYHDAIYIYGLQQDSLTTPDKGQATDLFRLMRQANALDQYAYEEYARKALDAGMPDEARTVIAEGRASGKLPATGASTQTAAQAGRAIATQGSLAGAEAKARAGTSGALASQTADAYLGKGEYAKAADLYRLALSKGGVNDDQVNTRLGIALAMSGDKAGAKTAFSAVAGAPRNDIAQFWMVWLDHPATT